VVDISAVSRGDTWERPTEIGLSGTSEANDLMAHRIQVMIVDDISETRERHLAKLLGFESDIEVVGTAASGAEAIEQAASLVPDVILMDINMPDNGRHHGDRTSLSAQVPVRGGGDDVGSGRGRLPAPLDAGRAREFLVKPFSSDELTASDPPGLFPREGQGRPRRGRGPGGSSLDPTHAGQVVAVFSPKGGVGRTTIAVNLAVAAASELGKKVTLVDASFQFGDVAVLLNLNPKDKVHGRASCPRLESADSIPRIDVENSSR